MWCSAENVNLINTSIAKRLTDKHVCTIYTDFHYKSIIFDNDWTTLEVFLFTNTHSHLSHNKWKADVGRLGLNEQHGEHLKYAVCLSHRERMQSGLEMVVANGDRYQWQWQVDAESKTNIPHFAKTEYANLRSSQLRRIDIVEINWSAISHHPAVITDDN